MARKQRLLHEVPLLIPHKTRGIVRGWRVRALIHGKKFAGPVRQERQDAVNDQCNAQTATTLEHMISIIKGINDTRMSSSSILPVLTPIQDPYTQDSVHSSKPAQLSPRPRSDSFSTIPYCEVQIDAWCGMHALNNYLKGPFVTPEACRLACAQVVDAFSQVSGGDTEDSTQHLDPESGWLSIDVINVLGAAHLGIHVEADSIFLDVFLGQRAGAALVNWNNNHWTVLESRSENGPWIHTNSIFGGTQSYHGRSEVSERSDVDKIFGDGCRHFGDYSIHCIVEATIDGERFLETAGRTSMLPPEEEILSDTNPPAMDANNHFDISQEVSFVNVNVDGLGDYTLCPGDRMTAILAKVLLVRPHFILMQEVTMEMYGVIHRTLPSWHIFKRSQQSEDYFNVTAVCLPATDTDKCTSYAFPTSHNGRHTLTVRRGNLTVINVHAESGAEGVDERSKQLRHLSRCHENSSDKIQIIAGDLNMRHGEDHCLLSEGWTDSWSVSSDVQEWTWQGHGKQGRYDRVYMHNSNAATVSCVLSTRLTSVWGEFTDHVALHTVVRPIHIDPLLVVPCQWPMTSSLDAPASIQPRGDGNIIHKTQCLQGQPRVQVSQGADVLQPRVDTKVVPVLCAVLTESARFRQIVHLCVEDPTTRADIQVELLIPWNEIPTACGFRVNRPMKNGVRTRKVSCADMLAQQQEFTKCKAWAAQCGLSAQVFLSKIHRVPSRRSIEKSVKFGIDGFTDVLCPSNSLKRTNSRNQWHHVRLECIRDSIHKAASCAGNNLGGDTVSTEALVEIKELLASESRRLKVLSQTPITWRSKSNLDLPLHSEKIQFSIRSLPGLFEMWLRETESYLPHML